jgi:dGTPase
MDWADDVAYSVHDLEDGIAAGLVPVDRLRDPAERDELCAVAAERYLDEPADALREVFDELLAGTDWPASFVGTAGEQASLKATTSTLIGRFCSAALRATREVHGARPLRRYDADLVVPAPHPRGVRAAQGRRRPVRDGAAGGARGAGPRARAARRAGHRAVRPRAPAALEPARAADWDAAADDAGRLRAVVDQVASLTDAAAAALHARLLWDGPRRQVRTGADGPTLPRPGTSPSTPPGSEG